MTITVDEMRQRILGKLTSGEDELIKTYEKLFDVKIKNEGDGWHPCYVEVENGEKK
jgi:hypothetical protein